LAATDTWTWTVGVFPGDAATHVVEEYRYDALGRRVWVRMQSNCLSDNAECHAPLVRRTTWDGAQELAEIQAPGTEATFLVGSQRPFVQVSRSLPTDVPSRDQVVQYRDVGTKLIVRPTINQDGYVSLLIQQEISGATDEQQFGAPVISTREAKTQVLVKNGQTIVLGGLRDQQRDRTRSGIPLLSALPVVGSLFGTSSRHTTATELFLFLTPRILETDADVDSVTTPRLPKLPLSNDNHNPKQ
jgi:type II secretory pathway component GspD/PulD (secretin)